MSFCSWLLPLLSCWNCFGHIKQMALLYSWQSIIFCVSPCLYCPTVSEREGMLNSAATLASSLLSELLACQGWCSFMHTWFSIEHS
uniref:Putative secreted protein n=1 Tax=Amblyomma parvum TaxID=251391 RepID=A0A023G242_AMBPA